MSVISESAAVNYEPKGTHPPTKPWVEEDNRIFIQEEPLSIEACTMWAQSDSCGAIATFIGTTRNEFNHKSVSKLEYEYYPDMAEEEIKKIIQKLRQITPELCKILVGHRVGTVPVGEISIIIVVSSPHRKEAISAVDFAIDHVKKTVPIWKKEFFSDGSTTWK
ncbi:molybdopterin converting factor subunit 2 [Conidiobolus coronatus NRRL 28638]|uniref:Molybdopterin converting factor subunit 2 n=1 Tax=Conidiobolus coronatus (strain ATCC 28846 / CBS 209.66 / NRRL 28638) TaxID=796925 RepID=A0A137P640_CONC2|nr:molybdopterin converting factor subunit 2 [Conidiobolus coronatus NRRL 28638]|eukprot:KXN70401.1 molybdopterin converting factor subunit 2 [Conidiobolus coronatus NRRL 28638]